MAPILEALRTATVRILLRLAFLRQVTLIIGDDLAHVLDVLFVVLARVFLRVLLQDLDDFAAAAMRCQSTQIVPEAG